MDISFAIAVEALEQLENLIAAWDEPHYGDRDMQIDTVFDEIEKARKVVEKADARLKRAGLRSRPHPDRRFHRRQVSEYPKGA